MEPPPDNPTPDAPAAAADVVEDMMLPQAGPPSEMPTTTVGKRKSRHSHPSASDTESAPEDKSASKRRKISHGAAVSHEIAPSASDISPHFQQAQLAPPDASTVPSSGKFRRSPLPQQTRSYAGTIIIDEADASIEEGRRVCELHEPDGQIYMFTDGSTNTEAGSGVGIVYRSDTRRNNWTEISQSLPDIKDINLTEAEALAVGVQFFGMDFGQDSSIKGLTALSDSENVLTALTKYDADTGLEDKLKELEPHVRRIHEQTEIVMRMGKTVTLRWVKAHGKGDKRVEGNARADELAKSANPWKMGGQKEE